jgi:predicted N-acyltransferase
LVLETAAVRFLPSLSQLDAQDWDALFTASYPFTQHQFLHGLEQTLCTTERSGWQPCHAVLESASGDLLAALPLYLKYHSYGEYVFDWAWADAWERSGRRYYPKLLTAIPFTPVTGPRLGCVGGIDRTAAWRQINTAVIEMAREHQLSSWHILYPAREDASALQSLGLIQRSHAQFHWFNRGYADFGELLAQFASRKRKALRKERERLAEQDVTLHRLTGAGITHADWQFFHRCYQRTYAKRSGHGGYLTEAFFLEVGPRLAEQVLMVVAEQRGRRIASALYFFDDTTLYGRYWGCLQDIPGLHFEACYYQGIEFCIARGLQRFDAGAQGEHKIQRGFEPIETLSYHWIAEAPLAAAVTSFVQREAEQAEEYREAAAALLPFRQAE